MSKRRRRNARAKRLIAESVASRMPAGTSIVLNHGSTTYAVAEALNRRAIQVRVTTSALNIAELLAQDPACRVNVVGGHLPFVPSAHSARRRSPPCAWFGLTLRSLAVTGFTR